MAFPILTTYVYGLQYHGQSNLYKEVLTKLNEGFTALFAIESALKIICLGPRVRTHWKEGK